MKINVKITFAIFHKWPNKVYFCTQSACNGIIDIV